jgi:hypothetical protein
MNWYPEALKPFTGQYFDRRLARAGAMPPD